MAVLVSSPHPPTTTTTTLASLSLLLPAFNSSLWLATLFQRLLSTTTIFLFFRAYLLTLLILQNSFYASQLLLLNTYTAARLILRNAHAAGKEVARIGWKSTEKARDKMFFEFMVFVLGGGNGLILVVFWPGWIVLGGGAVGVWCVCG